MVWRGWFHGSWQVCGRKRTSLRAFRTKGGGILPPFLPLSQAQRPMVRSIRGTKTNLLRFSVAPAYNICGVTQSKKSDFVSNFPSNSTMSPLRVCLLVAAAPPLYFHTLCSHLPKHPSMVRKFPFYTVNFMGAEILSMFFMIIVPVHITVFEQYR